MILPKGITKTIKSDLVWDSRDSMEEIIREVMRQALNLSRGNQTSAGKWLGYTRVKMSRMVIALFSKDERSYFKKLKSGEIAETNKKEDDDD